MMALNEDPNQDFLGDMYMKLSMGERAWGQIFTPYHVCEMMAQMTFDSPEKDIKDHGYVTTLDPAVGGGAMLIASAQALRDAGYDPKTQMIAVGQDVDITAVYMGVEFYSKGRASGGCTFVMSLTLLLIAVRS